MLEEAGAPRAGWRPTRSLLWPVLAVSAAPLLVVLLGVDLGSGGSRLGPDALAALQPSARAAALHGALSGDPTHTLLVWSALCAAVLTAVLGFTHFHVTRDPIALVIGVAFSWAGCTDGLHVLAAEHLVETPVTHPSAIPIGWAIGRTFHVLIAITGVGLVLARRNPAAAGPGLRLLTVTGVGLALVGSATLHHFASGARLPGMELPDALVTAPWGAVALALFALAGVTVYPALHQRRRDPLSEALWLSAIPAVAAQLHLSVGSSALYDTHLDAAHFLEAVSYSIPLIGLLRNYAGTYRSEQRARSELATREEVLRLFRFTVDHAADSAAWIDEEGRVLYANHACCATLGYSTDEILTLHISDIDPGLSAHRWAERWREVKRGLVMNTESEHRTREGRNFPVEITYNFVDFDGGASICAIFRDITTRRRIENAVRESELRLRSIVRTAPDSIITIDEHGTIDSANPATEKLFGYGLHELVGRNISMLMTEPYRSEHDGYLAEYRKTGAGKLIGTRTREVVGKRKDGAVIPLEIAVAEMMLPSGRVFTGIVRDISERRRAESLLRERAEELARSNAELQQFAYVASHDLQEPLRMVTSYVQLLERRYRDRLDDDAAEFIRFAADGASRMQKLIRDLLTYSRVGTRGEPLEPTDANAVLETALSNLSVAIEEAGARVRSDRLPRVLADSGQLVQVFQNLIANAIKFRREDPVEIQIGCQRNGRQVEISVRDNGLGIAPEFHERIFAVFQRLHTRREYDGTGIGLAIVKKVVERHGGRIRVESREGSGATFAFTLFLADQRGEEKRRPREIDHEG